MSQMEKSDAAEPLISENVSIAVEW